MPWLLTDILSSLPAFALVLFRLAGLFLTAPIYRSTMIPMRIRVALAAVIAVLIFPLVRADVPADATLAMAVVGGVGEMMIGATIGLGIAILALGAELAGMMIGQQAALGLAQVFNPNLETQTSILGQLYSMSFMFVFLLAGGHRATMAAVLDTYQVVPVLSFRFDETIVLLLIELLTASFVLAIRLAGPVLIALLLTETAMGVVSRTIPQLNILTVGFTLRIMMALAVAALALVASKQLLLDAVWDALSLIRSAFGLDPNDLRLVT